MRVVDLGQRRVDGPQVAAKWWVIRVLLWLGYFWKMSTFELV